MRVRPARRCLDSLAGRTYIDGMNLDLTDAETTALRHLLRQTIDGDRFPLSPHLRPYKAILAKIESPPKPAPTPVPPARPYVPSTVMRKTRGR
jgi:hypothetical protein